MSEPEKIYQEAINSLNTGKLADAEKQFKEFLRNYPSHVGALNLMTIVLMSFERYREAEKFIRKAVELNKNSDVSFYNYGIILKKLARPQEALAQFNLALGLKSNVCETWNNRGTVFNDLKKYQNAISDFDRAIELNKNYVDPYANKGKTLSQLKRHNEALAAYEKALTLKPDLVEACLGRGNAFYDLKRYDEALAAYDKALALKPDLADAWIGRGNAFYDLKRFNEALSAYDNARALKPDLVEVWLGRSNVFCILKRYDESLVAYDKALALKPDLAEPWIGRGNVLRLLKRHDDALAAYDKALALNPDSVEAWIGRGNVFYDLKRHDETLAAYDKARALEPDLADAWLGRGNVFYDLKRHEEALAAYDKALALKPDLVGAWLGRGNVFYDFKRLNEAFAAYKKALALAPDLVDAWLGRGNALNDLKRHDGALAAYDKARALKPDLADAWLGRGNVFHDLKRHDDALAAYDKALALNPDLVGIEGMRLHMKMHLCDWSNFDAECTHLITSVRNGNLNTTPLPFLAIASTSADRLQCAQLWIKNKCPASDNPIWQGGRYDHDRIRLGYLSADYRDHPVSFLLAGMFEHHDRSRFETIGFSLGPEANSPIRDRIKKSFETFIDIQSQSDIEIAELIRKMEVDILVDLMGITQGSRTNIFAKRPAPIQVNYLGFAGTMGADYIDYIIADQTVIPETQQKFYSEKVVYLPNSFMGTDASRQISLRVPNRAECGLPEAAFVFCSFNNSFKITPQTFNIWMRILNQVKGSVLWLSNIGDSASHRVRREAQYHGVDPSRIIFAQRVPLNEDHLARLQLADLFIDTMPYNAHTTANDALWAGLPVLTCCGESFAGRVAASLLHAIRLPELVTTTVEDYEHMAIDLANNPEKLTAIRRKLNSNRLTTPLFNTKLFTKHIEGAYSAMYQQYLAGLPPEHIVVTD